jgi:hypothetical protein
LDYSGTIFEFEGNGRGDVRENKKQVSHDQQGMYQCEKGFVCVCVAGSRGGGGDAKCQGNNGEGQTTVCECNEPKPKE